MATDRSDRIAGLQFELLYPYFDRANVKSAFPPHWSRLSETERLLGVADADPGSADAWRALGDHWLTKGNFMRARAAFDAALRLAPDDVSLLVRRASSTATLDPDASRRDRDAVAALAPATASALAASAADGAVADRTDMTVYVDITDIMDYLRVNTMFSGIQRVVANMLRQALLGTTPNARNVVPVIQIYDERSIYHADLHRVADLIETVEGGRPNRAQVDRLLRAVLASVRVATPRKGDSLLIAGAFWTVPSYDLIREWRERGVSICLFIHDLIQIDNPEFVHDSAKDTFTRSFADIAEITTLFTTNSAFVAGEVRRFIGEKLTLDKPVIPVPLATEMDLHEPDPWYEDALLTEFGPTGYVLCVCTIEIRKNHSYLFRIWEELIRRNNVTLPTLVFVGKWGWGIDDFRETLERSNYLDGAIRVLTGVSDEELAALYRNCRFSIYPSFVEGWGLPIGESLMLGRPCIASGVSSMPEVGGTLVRYFDPLDVSTGLAQVERVLGDPNELAEWTAQVRRDFKPRRWADFSEQLLNATRSHAGDEPPLAFARLTPGAIAVIGHLAVLAEAGAGRSLRTARMARHRGWDDIEDGGVWSIARIASLRFIADGCAPGEAIEVVLTLRAEQGQQGAGCRLRSGDSWTDWQLLGSDLSPFRCAAVVGGGGLVEIMIAMRGEPARHGNRLHYAHLSHVGYRRRGHAGDATALAEGLLFG